MGSATTAGNSNTGGDAGAATANIAGIWAGAQATKANGQIDYQLAQSGGSITGVARVTLGTVVYAGTVVGTVAGTTYNLTATYGGGYGVERDSGAVNGTSLFGNYTLSGGATAESGTVSFNKSAVSQTADISGSWAGAGLSTADNSTVPLFGTFSQTQNALTATFVANGLASKSATGIIIGDRATLTIVLSDNSTLLLDGTVSGSSLSGSYLWSSKGAGAFALNKQ